MATAPDTVLAGVAPRRFALTWDYRCPFARNATEHVLAVLSAGAPWDVRFVPFSLDQPHIDDSEDAVWDDATQAPSRLAMEAALVLRERYPETAFLTAHAAFFRARHEEARDITDQAVVASILAGAGIDPEPVLAAVAAGWPRELFRREHTDAVDRLAVFGVPTFIMGSDAVFIRIMDPPKDPEAALETLERALRVAFDHPELNEIKHTTASF